MLVPKDKLQAIYEHVKHKVQAAEGSVLICVSGETDAIAGCHILMVGLCPRLRIHVAYPLTVCTVCVVRMPVGLHLFLSFAFRWHLRSSATLARFR